MRGITPDLDARYHAECFRLHEAALTRTSLKAQPKALQVRKDVAPPADSLRWLCEDVLPSIRRHGKYPPPGGSAYLPERLAERGTVRAKAGAAADVVKPAAGGEGGRA
jgi:hypothetical protein